MKEMRKVFVTGAGILISFCLLAGSVNAEESGYKDWIAEEMREATQIPESLLKEMPTQELIIMIENYPLLCDLYAYNSSTAFISDPGYTKEASPSAAGHI